jgi:choice-of-anchor A domain-containing protein
LGGGGFGGGVQGFFDVAGPIAASGDVTPATGFSLNGASKQPYALISNGKINLKSGTVYGNTEYLLKNYQAQYVTYPLPKTGPSQWTGPIPFNFSGLASDLVQMSKTLNTYPSTAATTSTSQPGTVTFSGNNRELNVFSLTTDQVGNTLDSSGKKVPTTSFTFSVPAGSGAIINVYTPSNSVVGTNAYFKNARVNGTVPPNSKILWNFVDAQVLQISSMTLPGSILAPLAQAVLQNGAINGTVVVKDTLQVTIELHWFPFQGLTGTRGCLAFDPDWSCSFDTYKDDTGYVVFPAPEAGFLQIPGGSYSVKGVARNSPNHRIWYSFWPALNTPQSMPLAVIFNGGPGFGTSADLFLFNTSSVTFDPLVAGSSLFVSNPDTWQNFANVLYIDAPATGFSYPSDSNMQMDVGTDMDRDAGVFLSTITKFLIRHPALQKNPIILVGESYGGTRATLMLQHLFNYSNGSFNGDDYHDSQLLTDLQNYFSTVFATLAPGIGQVVKIFGHQALIEPALVGDRQYNLPASSKPVYSGKVAACISGNFDVYDCDQAFNWGLGESATAAGKLINSAMTLTSALGVDPTTIQWMYKSDRTQAHGRGCTSCPSSDFMNQQFGFLDSTNDTYLYPENTAVEAPYGLNTSSQAQRWYDSGAGLTVGTDFLHNVYAGVTSFITVAEYDGVIYSPSIAALLNNPTDFGVNAIYDDQATNAIGHQRNGLMSIYYRPDNIPAYVAMPHYYSGHSVPQHQAQSPLLPQQSYLQAHQLQLDIANWYVNTKK